MNLPSGKLMALLAVFAAIGVITGTGAFTTVSAERTATVNVAGDSSALLQLQPTSDYAQITSGTLEIALDGNNGDKGVNLNARTTINGVFNITNQGEQPVYVYITPNGSNADAVNFYNGSVGGSNSVDITDASNAEQLGVGQSTQISIEVDTRGKSLSDGDELINDITIYANATQPS